MALTCRIQEDVQIVGSGEFSPDTSVTLYGPPGTGKTTQLIARVVYLLNGLHDIEELLWATYRKPLATELLHRLVSVGIIEEEELSKPWKGPTRYIGTYHAVANRIAARFPRESIVQDRHRAAFCRQHDLRYWDSKDVPWVDPPGKLFFEVYDWLVNNLSSLQQPWKAPAYDTLIQNRPGIDFRSLSQGWESYKTKNGIHDFHEMLTSALDRPLPPEKRIVVFDEYHDADPLRHAVSKHWMEQAEIVIVAGDPHQVVNAFQGASPRFFNDLGLPVVHLDRSYRLGDTHWNFATSVLRQAHTPPDVECVGGDSEISEYQSPMFWFDDYHNRWETSGVGSPMWFVERLGNDVLFLARTREQCRAIRDTIEEHVGDIDDLNVRVMTIHGSKGTEADDVVLYDGITSTIRDSIEMNPLARKNEYRTWYVGLTRARHRIHIVRGGFDWTEPFLPNRV